VRLSALPRFCYSHLAQWTQDLILSEKETFFSMANNIQSVIQDGAVLSWFAPDHGLISWAYDPAIISGTYTLATAGTLYTVDLKVNTSTITNIAYHITTAGATLTAGQNYVGIYQGGTLLGASVPAATITQWGSTGYTSTPLASPVNVSNGIVTVAFMFNGTTGPTLGTAGTKGNNGLVAASSRFATAATGATTPLPSSLGTKSALAQTPWVAVS
jgi:hypothetical protein